mmetsp:Transcript_26539/g.47038  ORF Transcript_26539/g.47038 Transcript_26539/m.47038 type:complete len:382 (+) Transcript_26539:45-1190(+)
MVSTRILGLILPLALAVVPQSGQAPRSRSAPPAAAGGTSAGKPCDFKCCPCMEKTFSFKQEGYSFKQNNSETEEESCLPCFDWIDQYVAVEYKDYCSTSSCGSSSSYSAFPYDWTSVPRSHYTPYDYPVDYHHADGSVVRHIPGYGNETLPPNWGTGCYGNGWGSESSYYYPKRSISSGFYSRHHHRSNESSQAALVAAAEAESKIERAQIRESAGATVPTIFKIQRKAMASPCDLSCCSCASDYFTFADVVPGSSCMSCDNWVSTYVLPKYKDTCKCTAELKLKPYYTTIPHTYIKPECDYAHDSVYVTNSTVVRHVPSYGDVRYPAKWATPYSPYTDCYSNYVDDKYYYPDYSSYYYMPHSDAKLWTPQTANWFYADGY